MTDDHDMTTITPDQIRLAEKAVKALRLDDSIVVDEEGISFGGFFIEPVEDPITARTITGRESIVQRFQWAASEVVVSNLGGYWEPPDQDLREFARARTLLDAIGECAIQQTRHRVDHELEALHLMHLHNITEEV